MKAVMADYRAKVKQQSSKSTTSGETPAGDPHHVKGPAIGGVLMGAKGKEILAAGSATGTSTGSLGNDSGRLV